MTLIWLCSAFIAGAIEADSFGGATSPLLVVVGCCSALAWLWRQSSARLPLMLLAAFALGSARQAAAQPQTGPSSVWTYANTVVQLAGVVGQHPDWRDDGQIVVLSS